jgi:hypothetical protein
MVTELITHRCIQILCYNMAYSFRLTRHCSLAPSVFFKHLSHVNIMLDLQEASILNQ